MLPCTNSHSRRFLTVTPLRFNTPHASASKLSDYSRLSLMSSSHLPSLVEQLQLFTKYATDAQTFLFLNIERPAFYRFPTAWASPKYLTLSSETSIFAHCCIPTHEISPHSQNPRHPHETHNRSRGNSTRTGPNYMIPQAGRRKHS